MAFHSLILELTALNEGYIFSSLYILILRCEILRHSPTVKVIRPITPIFNDVELRYNLRTGIFTDRYICIMQLIKKNCNEMLHFSLINFQKRVDELDPGTQTDIVLGLSYSGNLRPNVKA